MLAIVRPPGRAFSRAVTSQVPRPVIDAERAHAQHAGYCAALRAAGLDLVELPADERYADACFVQDTAVVWGGLAVLARLGARTRRGEQVAVGQRLRAAGRLKVLEIRPPATLEGGDVLVVGSRVFVGLSGRTNRAGFAQLRDMLEPVGAAVSALPVPEGLHLLSGVTHLGRGVLLAAEPCAGLPAFAGLEVIAVPAEEAHGANALGVGDRVILAAGHPRVERLVGARGFQVLPVDLSEFAKADGGATCLSLLLP